MRKEDGYDRFVDIAMKAKRVIDSIDSPEQIEAAYRYLRLACNEMSDTEYYLKGRGDSLFNRTAHLFTNLDEMKGWVYE
jgi:hypothetical protein